MIKEDRRLKNQEIALLESLKGKKLVKIEAAIASPPNAAWNTVRLHTEDSAVDVNCLTAEVEINEEGDQDEFGVISVQKADTGNLTVDTISSPTEELFVYKEVERIDVFETLSIAKFRGVPFCEKRFTKAIVFYLSDECMVLDKLAWFDEMLRVSFGEEPESLLYDESQDWGTEEDENGVLFEYSIKRVNLC